MEFTLMHREIKVADVEMDSLDVYKRQAAGYGFYLQYTSRIQSGGGKNRIRWRTHSYRH